MSYELRVTSLLLNAYDSKLVADKISERPSEWHNRRCHMYKSWPHK